MGFNLFFSESIDEIKKQKDEVKISKADIKPVGALLEAKKAEHSKNNQENEVLPKRLKRETEEPQGEIKESIPKETSSSSAVDIKVPQQLTVSEAKLDSVRLTSGAAAIFDAKPITRDLKTVDDKDDK